MEISEVRVNLIENPTDRLKAFCSVTLDGSFVIRDIKLIEGGSGIFVAMPSRKLTDHCPSCNSKNHLRARYCNDCGGELASDRVKRDDAGRKKLHADIAHPINSECRQRLQDRIVEAFEEEHGKSQEPGYEPPDLHDDLFDEDTEPAAESSEVESREDKLLEETDFGPEESDCEPKQDDDSDADDYRSMISELKADAAGRRRDRGQAPRKQEQAPRKQEQAPRKQAQAPRKKEQTVRKQEQPAGKQEQAACKEDQPEETQGFGAGII